MDRRRQEPPGARAVERLIMRRGLKPRYAAMMIAALWTAAIVVFGVLEHLIDRETFGNVWLAMWWATQTVTTVGYGDVVPNEAGGQVLACLLMIGGLSLFSVTAGIITSAFVTRAQAQRVHRSEEPLGGTLTELDRKLDRLAAEQDAMRKLLERATGESPPGRE